MANKQHKPDEIVTKLRQVEVLVGHRGRPYMTMPAGDTFKHRPRLRKMDCINSGFCGQIETTTGAIRPDLKSSAHMSIGLQQPVSLITKFATIDP